MGELLAVTASQQDQILGYSTTVSAAGFDPDDECSIHSIPAKKRGVSNENTHMRQVQKRNKAV